MKTLWVITYILNNRFRTYATYDWTKADNHVRKVFENGANVLSFKDYLVQEDVEGVR